MATQVIQQTSHLKVLLFTDLVNFTRLKQERGDRAAAAVLSAHNQLFRQKLAQYNGRVIEYTGDGFFSTFEKPSDAVRCALEFQSGLATDEFDQDVQVRIGVHMGEFIELAGDGDGGTPEYVGLAIDTAARVMSLATGHQILLTRAVFDSARQQIKLGDDDEVQWCAHGPYRFKGIEDSLEIFEVGQKNVAPLSPPGDSEKARRDVSLGDEVTLGWRPARNMSIPGRSHWILEKRIGEGGFGEVWVARHSQTRFVRAFKFCFKAERLRSLKRELTLFRLLREVLGERPDIARLYDVRLDESPYFLEMEYTPGGDLIDWSENQGGLDKLDLALRLRLVIQTAEALSAAHSVGVLHKDIKPSNVLIRKAADGGVQACLTDFGIGELTDREHLEKAGITAAGFSTEMATGFEPLPSRTGTRLYMAPELIAGKPASVHTDIYATGVMLFQMLVGDFGRPLGSGWERDIEDEFLREDIRRCVDLDPQRRFSSAAELKRSLLALEERRAQRAAQLAREREERELRESAARARKRRRQALVAASIVSIAAVGLGAAALRERELRGRAEAAHLATAEALQARAYEHYLSNLRLAEAMLDQGNFALAAQTLEDSPEQFRGWEWNHLMRRARPGERLFAGHAGPVTDLVFDPESERFATASGDGTIRIWNTASQDEPQVLTGHQSGVNALALSPDRRLLASASSDGTARVWDLSPPHQSVALHGHVEPVVDVAFDAAGDRVLTASRDGTACLWDAATGMQLRSLFGHEEPLLAAAFFDGGKRAATASRDGSVRLWNAETGEAQRVLQSEGQIFTGFVFTPGESGLLTFGRDGILTRWNAADGKPERSFEGHTADITAAVCTPDGKRIVAAAADGTIRIWSAVDGRELLILDAGAPVTGLTLVGDSPLLMSSDARGRTTVWDTRRGERLTVLEGHAGPALPPAVDLTGEKVLTAGRDALVRLWQWRSAGSWMTYMTDETLLSRLAVGDWGVLACGGGDRAARWTVGSSEKNTSVVFAGRKPRALAAFHQEAAVALGLEDGSIELWNVDEAKPRQSLRGHMQPVTALTVTPDDRQLASASDDLSIVLWDVRDGKKRQVLLGHEAPILAVRFAPDGALLGSCDTDGRALIWKSGEAAPRATLLGHTGSVRDMDIHPDGKTIATGSADETVRLWNLESSGETRTLQGHSSMVTQVRFIEGGRRLVSASMDGQIKIWDPATGRELLSIDIQPHAVSALEVDRAGGSLFALLDNGSLRQLF